MENVTNLELTSRSSILHIIETHQQIFQLVNVNILSGSISMFGIIANIINLIVFYRQGLNSTITISLFALSVSDLSALILQQWHIIVSLLPLVQVPIASLQFQALTAVVPHETFARLTCSITCFITAERCLCVAFPMTISKIVTVSHTKAFLVCIYIVTLMTLIPFYSAYQIDWIFYPEKNRTLLGAAFTNITMYIQNIIAFFNAFFAMLSITFIVIFTSVLAMKVQKVSLWRQSANFNRKKLEYLSNRDTSLISMVVLIAIILGVCYIPSAILCVISLSEPEFSVGGKQEMIFTCMWTIALVFENINSTVNILLYLKMSSKYRTTFKKLFTSR